MSADRGKDTDSGTDVKNDRQVHFREQRGTVSYGLSVQSMSGTASEQEVPAGYHGCTGGLCHFSSRKDPSNGGAVPGHRASLQRIGQNSRRKPGRRAKAIPSGGDPAGSLL